ncbi:hypothetical protein [Paraburkholderia sp. J41]|uniref:hypothetical protein n=1 Tax=Paraburkholderia sp. J41 TaxID=2805433 RepID=UPI002AC365AB|nr:hypothetical protein [Paraburkholderia sp. J41]
MMAPEQQRQEENGAAAASPATYRKDRQRRFGRVRKIFRFFRKPARGGTLAHSCTFAPPARKAFAADPAPNFRDLGAFLVELA